MIRRRRRFKATWWGRSVRSFLAGIQALWCPRGECWRRCGVKGGK